MNVLAIATEGTQGAAALATGGEVLACVEAPRVSAHAVPRDAVRECLAAARLDADDVDRVVLCAEAPAAERRLRSALAAAEPALGSLPLARRGSLESQVAAAYLSSPFASAAVLLFPGQDCDASVHVWQGLQARPARLRAAHHLPPPHSPARLLKVFGHALGLPRRCGTLENLAYDLAYLGAYGAPRHSQALLAATVDLRTDGSFALTGPLAEPHLDAAEAARRLHRGAALPLPEPGRIDAASADWARSLAAVLRYLMGHLAIHVRRRTGAEGLCLGGDFALAMARARLLPEDGLFRQAWVHPQHAPAALALGAALLESATAAAPGGPAAGHPPGHPQTAGTAHLPFLGALHTDLSVEGFLQEMAIPADTLPVERIPGRAAELVRHRQRVGWFEGREESGTGAAGNRQRLSMVGRPALEPLADPRQTGHIPDPVTIAVLADQAERYFEDEPAPPFRSAPLAGAWLCYWRTAMAAAPTTAGAPPTGAPQPAPPPPRPPLRGRGPVYVLRVTAQRHPALYRVLEALQERTGVPLLLAEPLRAPGGPPARSPAAAYGLLRKGVLDALIVGSSVVLHLDELPVLPSPRESPAARLRHLVQGALTRAGETVPVRDALAEPVARLRRLGPDLTHAAQARWPFGEPLASYWRMAQDSAPAPPRALTPPEREAP